METTGGPAALVMATRSEELTEWMKSVTNPTASRKFRSKIKGRIEPGRQARAHCDYIRFYVMLTAFYPCGTGRIRWLR